jgi:hypothetical protein
MVSENARHHARDKNIPPHHLAKKETCPMAAAALKITAVARRPGGFSIQSSVCLHFPANRRAMIFLERVHTEHLTDRLDRSSHAVSDP